MNTTPAYPYLGLAKIIVLAHLALVASIGAARFVPGWLNLPIEGQPINLSARVYFLIEDRFVNPPFRVSLNHLWVDIDGEKIEFSVTLPSTFPVIDKYGRRTAISEMKGKWATFSGFIRKIRPSDDTYWFDVRSIHELP